jgi:hypothetical protein
MMNFGASMNLVPPNMAPFTSSLIGGRNATSQRPRPAVAAMAPGEKNTILATTTTKAFVISISVPKIHRCYVPPPEPEPEPVAHNHHHQQQKKLAEEEKKQDPPEETTKTSSYGEDAKTTNDNRNDGSVTLTTNYNNRNSNGEEIDAVVVVDKDAKKSVLNAPPIEACHETEGVVVHLISKDELEQHQKQQQQSTPSADSSFISKRKLSQDYDRIENMSMLDYGSLASSRHRTGSHNGLPDLENGFPQADVDGTTTVMTTMASIGSTTDPYPTHPLLAGATPGTPVRHTGGEIIGYVQGEESPKMSTKKQQLQLQLQQQQHDGSSKLSLQTSTQPKPMKRHHRKTSSGIPVVKDIVTAEELAAIVKIAPTPQPSPLAGGGGGGGTGDGPPLMPSPTGGDSSATKSPQNEQEEEEENGHQLGLMSTFDGVMKMVFGTTSVPEENEEGSTDNVGELSPKKAGRRVSYLTEAAAVAAIKRHPSHGVLASDYYWGNQTSINIVDRNNNNSNITTTPEPRVPNTEIKVSVLVDLALKNLRMDGHLLNRPVSMLARMGDEEWSEYTILAKDPSIGIILERLERIGVGSSVGSVSIFKAELCRTADLLEDSKEHAKENDNCGGAGGTDDTAQNATIVAARMVRPD